MTMTTEEREEILFCKGALYEYFQKQKEQEVDWGAILKILLPLLPGIIQAILGFLKGLDERERNELVDGVIKLLDQVLKGLPAQE